MDLAFEVSGGLRIALAGMPDRERSAVAAQLDPCPPAAPDGAEVVVARQHLPGTLTDLQRDAGDGRLTATDGRSFYVIEGGARCLLPAPGGPPLRFAYEPRFPIRRAFGRLVRPALQIALLDRDAVALHAAAVVVDGRAVLVAGWSESGKTETALALLERGARFLSDKWTVVGNDGSASVFPIGVGVRGWVLEHLPRMRAALGGRDRTRLLAARAARALARPARGGPAGGQLERVLTLGDRVALAPSAIREAYGDDASAPWRAPLRAVALLTTVPGPAVAARPADPAWAAARLARTADFERRGHFELHDRAIWALPDRDPDARARTIARERALLERILGSVAIIDVRAPFPADPRPVADAVLRAL